MPYQPIKAASHAGLQEISLRPIQDIKGVAAYVLADERERQSAAAREDLDEELPLHPSRNQPFVETLKRPGNARSISTARHSCVGDTFTSSDWSHVRFLYLLRDASLAHLPLLLISWSDRSLVAASCDAPPCRSL